MRVLGTEIIVGVVGTALLHGGIMAWGLLPSAPVVIPPQQIIEVSFVASPARREWTPEPVQQESEQPKEKGSVRSQSKETRVVVEKEESSESSKEMAAAMQPVFDATYLNNPPPRYPSEARRRKLEGKVLLLVDVTEEGEPHGVSISHSSGYAMLDEAALAAVKKWRFLPATRSGKPVAAQITVPIIFKIET